MNRNLRNPLLCLAGLALAGSAFADTVGPCSIASNVRPDGTVELSNTANVAKCDTPSSRSNDSASAPAAAPSAPAKVTSSASEAAPVRAAVVPEAAPPPPADAQSASSSPTADPREAYKNAMLEGAPGTTGANPAVARRYKMMDKATYQATVLNGATPTAQGDAPVSPAPAQ